MALRELFVLVTILAMGCAAFLFAGFWAAVLFSVALLIVVGMAIIAAVDRGSRQAYAIGFTVAAMIYVTTVLVTHTGFGGGELDPYSCVLPTTKLLAPAFTLIVKQTWIDLDTRKEVPNYIPPKASTGGGFYPASVGSIEYPDRRSFTAVGHMLWTLLFGYVGGYFARRTYARRQADDSRTIQREAESR